MGSEPATAWRSARIGAQAAGLLFGRMHEDWAIEAQAFKPGGRVFCIASAGCTALALAARGFTVTAVDINPAQVAYVSRRLAGGGAECGAADRLLGILRRSAAWLGIREADLRAFLLLQDTREQARVWRERFALSWRRAVARALLSRPALRTFYSGPFVAALPRDFGRVLLGRLERGFGTHANAGNPYAWRLLLGCDAPGAAPEPAARPFTLRCCDALTLLEKLTPESFDGFSLSNILDGAGPEYAGRLLTAVRRAAAPGALIVLRSFAEPQDLDAERGAIRDRSLLWGSVRVEGSGL